jgi:hypothetical protein
MGSAPGAVGERSYAGDGFRREYERGKAIEALIAAELEAEGFDVGRGLVEWLTEREAVIAGSLTNEPDLLVAGRRLEVKGRELRFSSREDYPFPTAFVGRQSRWDRRSDDVLAVVLVSTLTGARVVAYVADRERWVVEECFDRITHRDELSYACPRDWLGTWPGLVRVLRRYAKIGACAGDLPPEFGSRPGHASFSGPSSSPA